MALVRCTCLASVADDDEAGLSVVVTVADPACGYGPHRVLTEEPLVER